jgi:tetratricopeptide (TPR) repeat protein
MKRVSSEVLLRDALANHRYNRLADARKAYRQVLVTQPAQAEALSLLPLTLISEDAQERHLAWGKRAIRLSPSTVMNRINHGHHLKALGNLAEAQKQFRFAQILDPSDPDGSYNEGVLFAENGNHERAILKYEQALKVKPDYLQAKSNLGFALLSMGNFAAGWPLYDTRFAYDGFRAWSAYQFRYPQWDGVTDLRGKRIALWAEQGLGDALQFCRFASLLADTGAVITVVAHAALHRILSSLQGVHSVFSEPPAEQDFHFPLMSLPRVFGITVKTIPFASKPYLSPNPTDVAEWRSEITTTAAPRVGIAWRAGAISKIPGRNLDIRALADLSGLSVTFICLQKEVTAEEREFLQSSTDIVVLDREQRDFADTAAIIDSLDLVISVDTSVAHLSAALGKETYVLLPKVCDWRWMVGRVDSPWYSSVRLLRQQGQGDWSSVVTELRQILVTRYASAR